MKYNGLWIGKTGDPNAWYHIYPFATATNSKILHIIRYKKALRSINNTQYHLIKGGGTFIECIRMFFKGLSVIRKEKIDYIITFNLVPWGTIAWILAKLFKKPILVGYIGKDFHFYLKKWPYKLLLNFINKRSNMITVTGNHMIEPIVSTGIDSNKVNVFPHCVDDKWLSVNRKEIKYDIITVGQLIKRKRVQDIILAVDLLREKGVAVRLAILGDGPEQRSLLQLARSRDLETQIDFLGYQQDVVEFLKVSRIYVQASSKEGLSLSLIEAMAAGLIPVTTIAGSEEDHIKDKYNGLFYDVGNIEKLANCINSLLNEEYYLEIKKNLEKERFKLSMDYAVNRCEEFIKTVNHE